MEKTERIEKKICNKCNGKRNHKYQVDFLFEDSEIIENMFGVSGVRIGSFGNVWVVMK